MCVCLSVTLISQQRKVHLGSWRYRRNWHDKGILYLEFNAISLLLHAFSCNFHTISHNFGYFSHFWANFYMLGIKMHVLELRNSLVILSKISHACSRNFMQFSQEDLVWKIQEGRENSQGVDHLKSKI